MEDTQNELEQVKKTVWMMNSSTTFLVQIMMMERTKKCHGALGFKVESLEIKPPTQINVTPTSRNYHHKGGLKNNI